jgi:hypothetical protein
MAARWSRCRACSAFTPTTPLCLPGGAGFPTDRLTLRLEPVKKGVARLDIEACSESCAARSPAQVALKPQTQGRYCCPLRRTHVTRLDVASQPFVAGTRSHRASSVAR